MTGLESAVWTSLTPLYLHPTEVVPSKFEEASVGIGINYHLTNQLMKHTRQTMLHAALLITQVVRVVARRGRPTSRPPARPGPQRNGWAGMYQYAFVADRNIDSARSESCRMGEESTSRRSDLALGRAMPAAQLALLLLVEYPKNV